MVLFGIESHVCVLQTTLDLLERGHDVHIASDGVSSRHLADRHIALQRMRDSGAFISTTESLVFQLLGNSKHPQFKTVQKLIRQLPPESPLRAKV